MLPDLDDGDERPARYDPGAALDEWTARFVTQLAAPTAQHITLTRDGRTEHILIDVTAGTWAALHDEGNRWIVRQGGPTRLWNAVEDHLDRWHTDGKPPLDRFEITVTAEAQTITWPSQQA